MRKSLHLLVLLTLLPFIATSLSAQNCGCTNCPVDLPDQLTQTFTGNLVVMGATNNTLGGNNTLQQICIDITHDWIGDLDITLVAPDGTQVVLFGDGNNDNTLLGTETCPCGNSGDDMDVCFVLSGTTNNFSVSNAGTGNICNGNQSAYVACNGNPSQPCYTGLWLPYDQNCNGPDLGLAAVNNGTGTVNGTWQLIIHDNAGANQGVLNDFSLVFANTTGINCNSGCGAEAGTVTATGGTGTGSNATTVVLCSGQSASLVSNDNYVLPNPMSAEVSELMYALYNCAPPANPNPDVDACYSGVLWTAEDFNTANGGSYATNLGDGIPQGFVDAGVTGTNNTIWFVPITCDDSDNNGNPNNVVNWDQDNDNCFDVGTPIAVIYTAVPDITIIPDCNPASSNGSITFTVIGSGSYTINETGAGNLQGGTSVTAGSSFTINGLNNTNVWAFSLTQAGCATSFTGTFACAPDICLIDAVIIANPPPSNFPNNQYPPNTTVTFCIDINQYNQTNLNFLHGIVPSFSGGWQPAITPTVTPAVAANNEAGSYWGWQAGGTVLHNNGTNSPADNYLVPNAGWWFHSINSPGAPPIPTNATNSWGDGCTAQCYAGTNQVACEALGYDWIPGCGCASAITFAGIPYPIWVGPVATFPDFVDNSMNAANCAAAGGTWDAANGVCEFWGECLANPTTGFGLQWYACFQLTTLADPACLGNTNLNVSVQTYADGLTGVWDEYGCTGDAPVTWTSSLCCLAPPTENTPATFCQGAAITLTANAPATGQINWYGDGQATGGTPVGVGNSFNPGTLAPGSYTYYIETNNGGCLSNRTPVAFTVNPLPTLSIVNGDAISCTPGTPVNISITAANVTGNVTWTSNPAGFTATGTSINPAPSVTTTYTASATNSCGTVTVPITISVNSVTVPNVPNTTICGANTTLNAGAGYSSYTWAASGGGTISGPNDVQTITVTSAGTYTVTVTANGCSATDNAVVTVATPAAATPTQPTCGLNNGSISVTPAGGTYAWTGGLSGNNPTGVAPGTYTVTVTGAGGCTSSASTTLNSSTGITAAATPTQPTCGLNNGSISVTPAGGTYAWTGGLSGSNPTGVAPGTYTVTVTGAGGCTSSASVTLNASTGITAAAAATQPTCGLNNGSISVTPAGGAYAWTGGLSGSNPTNVAPGTYTVTVTGAGGCTSSASVTLNASTGITAAATPTQPTCGLNNGSISVTPAGGTYAWTGGLSGNNPTGVAPGTYTVTVTGAGGCTSSASATLNASTGITAAATPTQPTCGLNNGSISVTPAGGTYAWTGGLSGSNPTGVAPGTYTVTVTGAGGCTSSASVTLNASTGITASATPTQPTCGLNNGSISVTPTGGTYAWTGGLSGSNPTGVAPGTYTVTVTGAGGCTSSASTTLNASTGITAAATPTQPTCGLNNGSISVTPTGGTYAWTGGLSGSNPTGVAPGTYTVTVTDVGGCTATATATLNASTGITAAATPTQPTCGLNNGSISVTPTGGTYVWTGGLSGSNPTGVAPGTYTVTVTGAG
ncbi:hypothetical protein C7N43_36590, partial [Sphingobacteriales bacterium UPWRP_1]